MDVCHVLLGRPWQYNWHVIHDGKANTYIFCFENPKITLFPSKDPLAPLQLPSTASKSVLFLTHLTFEVAMQEIGIVYTLVTTLTMPPPLKHVSYGIQTLLQEFLDVF